jgi:hypothetical protein
VRLNKVVLWSCALVGVILAGISYMLTPMHYMSKPVVEESTNQISLKSVWKTQVLGRASSCNVAPEFLMWSGHTYKLAEKDTESEPGNLVGYVQCVDGQYMYTETPGGQGIHVLHINGEKSNGELILFVGGRALYSPFIEH